MAKLWAIQASIIIILASKKKKLVNGKIWMVKITSNFHATRVRDKILIC